MILSTEAADGHSVRSNMQTWLSKLMNAKLKLESIDEEPDSDSSDDESENERVPPSRPRKPTPSKKMVLSCNAHDRDNDHHSPQKPPGDLERRKGAVDDRSESMSDITSIETETLSSHLEDNFGCSNCAHLYRELQTVLQDFEYIRDLNVKKSCHDIDKALLLYEKEEKIKLYEKQLQDAYSIISDQNMIIQKLMSSNDADNTTITSTNSATSQTESSQSKDE